MTATTLSAALLTNLSSDDPIVSKADLCQESRKHDRLWRMLAANMGTDVETVRRAMNSIGKTRH